MNDEEKAEESYNKIKLIEDISPRFNYIKGYLDGLTEGRKENEKENARLSKMLEMAINEVLLCGKQMKVEHPTMIVWTEETFRAELEKRLENEK